MLFIWYAFNITFTEVYTKIIIYTHTCSFVYILEISHGLIFFLFWLQRWSNATIFWKNRFWRMDPVVLGALSCDKKENSNF